MRKGGAPQHTLDLRKTAFNSISAWDQHTTEAKLLHWKGVPYQHVFKRLTWAQNWAHAEDSPATTHGTSRHLQVLAEASFSNTERGTAGLNWRNLQSQRQREEGESNSGAEEEGQTFRWQDVRLFPWQKRNMETEREGSVPQDCWIKGVCKVPLSFTGFSNTWELL